MSDADTIPILQIRIKPEHGATQQHVVNLLPGDLHALFAGIALDHTQARGIPQERIAQLAAILGTPVTAKFSRRIHDAVIGFALIILHGWHSPRWHREFYRRLKRKPLEAQPTARATPGHDC